MKISKLLLFAIATVLIFTITSCKDTKSKSEMTEEQGHEHNADGNHMNNETVEQEEFTVEKDSLQIKEETHSRDNSEEQHKY